MIASYATKLRDHQKALENLLQEVPAVDGFPCKYFLFLTRLKGITAPFLGLYDRLIEKQMRQADVFDVFRVDLRTHIYVDVAIREGAAFRRPLRQVVSTFDWVHLSLREFIFVFGDPADHKSLFNDWVIRITPDCFMEAARIMVSDIMRSLVVNAIEVKEKTESFPSEEEARLFVIDLMRRELFKAYAKDERNWLQIKEHLSRVDACLDEYASDFKSFCSLLNELERKGQTAFSPVVNERLNHYQLRGQTENKSGELSKFYQCGIELEFQTPIRFIDIEHFAQRVRHEASMYALSTTSNEEAFLNPNGGVLAHDESLPRLEGYFPTEYSSAVIRGKEDEERVARMLRYINQRGCLVDDSCGIHMHVSRDGCSLEGLKNLVLRFARLEKLIRQCFFNKSRSHDWNMFGPSLLSLYGGVETARGRAKSFLLMTHFVHRAKDIDELFDASSCSGRYASLYLKTKLGTLEFRGHPATMSVKRVMNYFEFTQAFVDSAMINGKSFIPFHRLRKAIHLRKIDKTKCLPDPFYATCSCNSFDGSCVPPNEVRNLVRERAHRVTSIIAELKHYTTPAHNYDGQLSHKKKTENKSNETVNH